MVFKYLPDLDGFSPCGRASIWGHRNMWLNAHAPWSNGFGYWDIEANPNQSRIGAAWMDCAFNISFVATEQEILSTRPDSNTGEVVIAYGSDTFKLYIYYEWRWYIYNNASQVPFNINFQGTEQEILATQPNNPSGETTIAYGTDTNYIYVYYQRVWYIIYNHTSSDALSVQWFEKNEQNDLVLRSSSIESADPAIELWEETNSTDYSPRETDHETSEDGIQYFEETGQDVTPRINPLT